MDSVTQRENAIPGMRGNIGARGGSVGGVRSVDQDSSSLGDARGLLRWAMELVIQPPFGMFLYLPSLCGMKKGCLLRKMQSVPRKCL